MKHFIISALAAISLTGCAALNPLNSGANSSSTGIVVQADDPCVGTAFDIYFGVGQSDLSESSALVIEQISKAYEPCQVNFLNVEGHADASGDEALNLAISKERADNVVQALTEAGISADSIRIVPFGEQNAITGDGAIKPLNRKTTVRIVT